MDCWFINWILTEEGLGVPCGRRCKERVGIVGNNKLENHVFVCTLGVMIYFAIFAGCNQVVILFMERFKKYTKEERINFMNLKF